MKTEFKICKKCKKTKAPSEFYYQPRNKKDGLWSECKKCCYQRTVESRKDPKKKEMWRKWDDISKFRRRLKKHNMTEEQFKELISQSKNKCAICEKEDINYPPKLNIDHNHITGKLRELLCPRCNRSIGLFHERIDLLESAISYLKKHSKP